MDGRRFKAELIKLVENLATQEATTLAAGKLNNMRDYKFHAGKLLAYRHLVQLCDEAEKKVNT